MKNLKIYFRAIIRFILRRLCKFIRIALLPILFLLKAVWFYISRELNYRLFGKDSNSDATQFGIGLALIYMSSPIHQMKDRLNIAYMYIGIVLIVPVVFFCFRMICETLWEKFLQLIERDKKEINNLVAEEKERISPEDPANYLLRGSENPTLLHPADQIIQKTNQ